MPVLWVQSGITGEDGFIQIFRDDKPVAQLSPAEARELAGNLLQCAEASEQDHFLFHFAEASFGSRDAAGVLMKHWRRYREDKGKKGPPSDPQEFVVTDQHVPFDPTKK